MKDKEMQKYEEIRKLLKKIVEYEERFNRLWPTIQTIIASATILELIVKSQTTKKKPLKYKPI